MPDEGFTPHKDYRGFVPAQQFYEALIARGFAPNAARGILGNLMYESGGGGRGGVYLDPPTDAGHYNWGTGDAAVGAAQWEGRRQQGIAPTLQSQVDKIWSEFNNPGAAGMQPGALQILQAAKSPGEAANFINTVYERPLKPEASAAQRRQFSYLPLQGTTLTTPPPDASLPYGHPARPYTPTPGTAVASNAPTTAAPTTTQPQGPPQTVQEALQRLTAKNEKTGKSPLDTLGGIFSPNKDAAAAAARMQPPSMPQAPADTGMASYEPAAQLLAATMQQSAKPLSWSTAPYGSGTAGPQQAPGMTLSSNPYSPYGPFGQIYG